MSQIEELQKAVINLNKEERRAFRDWFTAFDSDLWDEQLEADAQGGKLDHLANEALTEYKKGNAREI